jgi:hypothetical protein
VSLLKLIILITLIILTTVIILTTLSLPSHLTVVCDRLCEEIIVLHTPKWTLLFQHAIMYHCTHPPWISTELIDHIIGYLHDSRKDLQACALVCKVWLELTFSICSNTSSMFHAESRTYSQRRKLRRIATYFLKLVVALSSP